MTTTDPAPGAPTPSDEQLWSWVDRDAPELAAYLASGSQAAARVDEIRRAIGTFEAADPAVLHPTSIGEYHIEGVLGRGGMGVVYDALQESPKRRVALKLMPSEYALDKRWLRRFQREADALARLSHPGIASIYEVGRAEEGHPYIAMERIEGVALNAHLERTNPSKQERLRLARDLSEAIGHAHYAGVVHRDIKPANILVNSAGNPMVVDFGLARIVDDELSQQSLVSQTGTLQGTLPYMSPEQVTGRSEIGTESDVYSLGVVLYELLVGHMPYDMKELTLVEAARQIQETPPRRTRRVRRKLRSDLGVVIFKALEKDPARRYPNATELADDLRRCAEGRPVEAVPVSLGFRIFQGFRRHWIATTATVIGGILAALLILPTQFPLPLSGNWWSEGAPFEDIRWLGDSPEVQVEGRWYALVAIDDLRSGHIVGFCQQTGGLRWRKRFSEDLVQVLNRLGTFGFNGVDLKLRDLNDGTVFVMENVPMREILRRQILMRRTEWPWSFEPLLANVNKVKFQGNQWKLISLDGAPIEQFKPHLTYDTYCDRFSRSPGVTVDFVIEDKTTGERREFEDVPRYLESNHGR